MGTNKATVITVGIQKGGTGKSTTAGILSYLLAEEGNRVLVIDMDSQGNVTNLLTGMEQEDYEGETILEAFEEKNIKPYIYKQSERLHVVPADDYLAMLARFLYTKYPGKNKSLALTELIEPIKRDYDFIIIDTPPSLAEPMTNSVCASDFAVVLAESSKWAFTAIPRFLKTIDVAREMADIDIKVIGILRTMQDVRRADFKAFCELIGEDYPELVFDTVIKRKAAIGRISLEGFEGNSELKDALKQYREFYKEFKERIGVK
jgi:chromosome partitioning protein